MSKEGRPPVWQMLREAVEALGSPTTNVSVRNWVLAHYPGTNTSTIQTQIVFCTVNHPSRIHGPENSEPGLANRPFDCLFRPERGKLELYDPTRHGQWQVLEREDGRLSVGVVGEGPAVEVPESVPSAEPEPSSSAFAAEAHLRDYLARNLHAIEPGLELYTDEDGTSGVEYITPIGRIDILAVDGEGGLVVLELKVSHGPDSVAGQVLRYTNWVKQHLAQGKRVRGVIIAQHVSEKTLWSIASSPEISVKRYELSLRFHEVPRLDE